MPVYITASDNNELLVNDISQIGPTGAIGATGATVAIDVSGNNLVVGSSNFKNTNVTGSSNIAFGNSALMSNLQYVSN